MASLPAGANAADFAVRLVEGGATLIQYRHKAGLGREVLAAANAIREAVGGRARLIMNDRADFAVAAGFAGVHLGQDDLSPTGARMLCPAPMLVGCSTHNPGQVAAADQMPVDYIAIGPVFATASKQNPDPVVGLEGVRAARKLTAKPLVAIGGITLENCGGVIAAGADAVGVISAIRDEPRKTTEAFLRVLG